MTPTVERLEEINTVELGEGPHWDADNECLYFVDIFGKAIHKYVPETKKHTKAVIDSGTKNVTLIIPLKGKKDKFLISIGRELFLITWDGESENVSTTEKLFEVDDTPETSDNTFNDGKCDPTGRLWAGTMGSNAGDKKNPKGALYSFSKNESKKHISNIGVSNGLAWDSKLKKFYHIDTHKGTVAAYDFDSISGSISNCQSIFTLHKHKIGGALDGMTIDTDGNLWIAVIGTFKVIKIDPRKPETLLETIEIPAKQVTSVTFGGKNLDELYVTSGKISWGDEVLNPPNHGGTYKITGTNAKGYPGVNILL